jgi:hypothetical protein
MENNIVINPYLFYGLIGAIAYLLWLTRWLNKAVVASIQMHQTNAELVTESFELISTDMEKLSDGLDKLEGQIEYVSNKENEGTTS